MSHFYTPWKCQKTYGFLTFPGCIKCDTGLKWVNYIHHVGYVNWSYFWNQPLRDALRNRRSTYFDRASYDVSFCIKMLFLTSFLCVFNYIFLKEKSKKKICFTNIKFNALNPFVPSAPFLYPLKTSENLNVFWCFQGVEEECLWY